MAESSQHYDRFAFWSTGPGHRPTFDAGQAANCCPRQCKVIFIGHPLFENDLKVLGNMCSRVKRLEVAVPGRRYEVLDALCDCLRTWSSTLEFFSLYIEPRNPPPQQPLPPYQPLSQVLSTLNGLRELVLIDMKLDMDAISELPRLERLKGSQDIVDEDLMRLSRHLRDAKKFPALNSVTIEKNLFSNYGEGRRELDKSCAVREIDLRWVDRSNLLFLP